MTGTPFTPHVAASAERWRHAMHSLAAVVRQMVDPSAWKAGDELLPFHPQASHVAPDYRDG